MIYREINCSFVLLTKTFVAVLKTKYKVHLFETFKKNNILFVIQLSSNYATIIKKNSSILYDLPSMRPPDSAQLTNVEVDQSQLA